MMMHTTRFLIRRDVSTSDVTSEEDWHEKALRALSLFSRTLLHGRLFDLASCAFPIFFLHERFALLLEDGFCIESSLLIKTCPHLLPLS